MALPAIKHKPSLSEQQQMRLVDAARYIALRIVLPYIGAILLMRNYYWQLLLLIISVNLLINFAKWAQVHLQQIRSKQAAAKIEKIEKWRQEMLNKSITPSLLTVSFLRGKGVDIGSVLIDDPTHIVDVIRQFFDPFRRRDPAGGGVNLIAHRARHAFTRVLTLVWVCGWILSLGLLPFLPHTRLPLPLGNFDTGGLLIAFMTTWTAAWLAIVLWLWPRDRFIVTKEACYVLSRRWPFQDEGDWTTPMSEIQSVNTRVPFWGKVLRYAHLEIVSWQQPESIPQRKFVRASKRACVIFETYATGSGSIREQLQQQRT